MSRPEHIAPPEIFYNEEEAEKYASNSRIIEIQSKLSERCVELLRLPAGVPCLLLDLGCGSGLSGAVLSDAGHQWVGLDISEHMLAVARARDAEGDLARSDLGHGLPFRPGAFDGAISVSALQWLCNADRATHLPRRRLKRFFQALFAVMRRGARAALQFYPENADQMDLVTRIAMRCGFSGGIVVDFPNSAKAKKYYLCLSTGQQAAPGALAAEAMLAGATASTAAAAADFADNDGDDAAAAAADTGVIAVAGRERVRSKEKAGRVTVKSRDWILNKKERQRRQGKEVRPDTKYSGRPRRRAF